MKKPLMIICVFFALMLTPLSVTNPQEKLITVNTLVKPTFNFITSWGQEILPLEFSEGLVLMRNEMDANLFGYIDKTGKTVIPILYESAGQFIDGMAYVRKDRKFGFINKEGEVVIPLIYLNIEYDGFHEGLMRVGKEDGHCYIDRDGNEVLFLPYTKFSQFTNLQPFCEGLAAVTIPVNDWAYYEKVGFINKSGELVIPTDYMGNRNEKFSFSEGLACVKKDNKFGYIDVDGNVVIPFIYDRAYNFNDGLAYVFKYDETNVRVNNEMSGFIDKSGELIIPYNYLLLDGEYIIKKGFCDSLMLLIKDSKYGFMDKNGTEVIPCEYDWAMSFNDGYAYVKKDDMWGFIDTSGNITVPLGTWEYPSPSLGDYAFSEGLIPMQQDGLYGYINKNGEVIVPFKYENAMNFHEGLAWVKKNGLWGILEIQK